MCLVVNYSEKSVKSDYFGVIIYNWWRKDRKIRIFAKQNAYFTESSYEHPKYSGFSIQKPTVGHFSGRIHQKIRKIRKITVFHTKLISSINIVGRKFRKIGFYGKTSTNFKPFSLQLIAQVTIIVEHTENSHNSQLYTI